MDTTHKQSQLSPRQDTAIPQLVTHDTTTSSYQPVPSGSPAPDRRHTEVLSPPAPLKPGLKPSLRERGRRGGEGWDSRLPSCHQKLLGKLQRRCRGSTELSAEERGSQVGGSPGPDPGCPGCAARVPYGRLPYAAGQRQAQSPVLSLQQQQQLKQ